MFLCRRLRVLTCLLNVLTLYQNSNPLSTSVDDVVLMALSTSTAVTGFATSMFGAVNSMLGISEPTRPTTNFGADLDMSGTRPSDGFRQSFERTLYVARATKKASIKLDELLQIDKKRVCAIDGISHFFEKVSFEFLLS